MTQFSYPDFPWKFCPHNCLPHCCDPESSPSKVNLLPTKLGCHLSTHHLTALLHPPKCFLCLAIACLLVPLSTSKWHTPVDSVCHCVKDLVQQCNCFHKMTSLLYNYEKIGIRYIIMITRVVVLHVHKAIIQCCQHWVPKLSDKTVVL